MAIMTFSTRSFIPSLFLTLVLSAAFALAEQHTIKFDNQCGHGTPHLLQKGNILSTGQPFTSTGPFYSGIAYLQTGNCNLNGEGCSLVEMSLINPGCPGCGSSTDISLIPPLAFSVPVSFSYFGGCAGQGTACMNGKCNTAFFKPDDNQVQVACQDKDVNLLITFCPGGAGAPAPPPNPPKSPVAAVPAAVKTTAPAASTHTSVVVPTPATTLLAGTVPALSNNSPSCPRNRSSRRRRSLAGDGSARVSRHAKKRSERRQW